MTKDDLVIAKKRKVKSLTKAYLCLKLSPTSIADLRTSRCGLQANPRAILFDRNV